MLKKAFRKKFAVMNDVNQIAFLAHFNAVQKIMETAYIYAVGIPSDAQNPETPRKFLDKILAFLGNKALGECEHVFRNAVGGTAHEHTNKNLICLVRGIPPTGRMVLVKISVFC